MILSYTYISKKALYHNICQSRVLMDFSFAFVVSSSYFCFSRTTPYGAEKIGSRLHETMKAHNVHTST